MHILVTAGNTLVMIDRVRAITNMFTGRTGAAIALEAQARGHVVTLITSHPEVVENPPLERWRLLSYRTFEDLEMVLREQIAGHDAVLHCAAVSDYLVDGIYAPMPNGAFEPGDKKWHGNRHLRDCGASKVKSDEPELWLRLRRAPKLIDKMRGEWGFKGTLVKFKLEVGISEETLREIAEQSRRQSHADWMVANTLEGASAWALIGNERGYKKITRAELPAALVDLLPTTA